jgi:hypothetical protein
MMTYYRRLNVCGRASTQLAIQFNSNRQGSATYVASRGRPLKEDNQTISSVRNPNYLGIVELRSQFDPFCAKTLEGVAMQETKSHHTCLSRFVKTL